MWSVNKKWLIASFIFILFGVLVMVLFPNEARFKYEFAKGKPWQHNSLIAPFSFPVKKTEAEIVAEKDSIIKHQIAFFDLSQDLYEEKIALLKQNFFVNPDIHKKEFQLLDSLLRLAYSSFILKPIDLEKLKSNTVYIVKDKYRKSYPISLLKTPKKLYLELINVRKQAYIQNKNYDISFLNGIDFSHYLESNLKYNASISEEVLNESIKKISTTSGLIQKGELIISTGEIVNDNDYEILRSYRSEYEKRYSNSGSVFLLLGNLFIIAGPLVILYFFLFQYRKKILMDYKKLLFVLSISLLFILVYVFNSKLNLIPTYLIPIIILPIVVRSFFDTRLANFVFLSITLLVAYLVPNSYDFLFLQIIAGVIAVFSLAHITKRSHIFRTSGLVFLSYSIGFLGMSLLREGDWHKIEWIYFVYFAANAISLSVAYPLVYICEKVFGFTSDATLLELSDTNHKLLKSLSEKAPGTFQHSLQVANIAESLIRAIGGNPLLVRTGALYHDIGKMLNPGFFTENQTAHFNPHKNLTSKESAKVIIQHVTDGLILAKKHNLPQAVANFIPTHQGTMEVKFFLNTYKNEHPDEEVDTADFTYPGPKPNSKETAVVMIADSIEAASRSLQEYNKESISALVDKIVDYQMGHDQFSNVNMTFKDVLTIKEVLIDKLGTIYHTRIAYPD